MFGELQQLFKMDDSGQDGRRQGVWVSEDCVLLFVVYCMS